MTDGPLDRYRALVAAGEITFDPAQCHAAEALQLLENRLKTYKPPEARDFFSFLMGRRATPAPKGLYIFGGVGRGKTMLMDLFYESTRFTPKRRIHFHEFMAETHEAIARMRKIHDGDPIAPVAQGIARSARLLCLDEFQVTDITDAMILGRLFSVLFDEGVVLVATSNTAPADLYRDGLNRQLFLPFIERLEEELDLLQLEAARDYRLDKLGGAPVYYTPLGEAADQAMEALWQRLTGNAPAAPHALRVKGRCIEVPLTAAGIARFTFSALCEQPLGASDYLTIARSFHTLFLHDIPVMGPEKRNAARRFVHLIDALYDNRVRLIASAAAEPEGLYPQGDGVEAFARTVSRLQEMRSAAYLGT